MDYEEKVIALLNGKELSQEQKEKLEEIFPELAESEDEKMRKSIIYALQNGGFYSSDKTDEAIAWLEKQGKQKTDKVEPKFKVGDWIVLPLGIIAHIESINSTDYQVTTTDGKICDFKISKQDNYRLWTIEDAKDGDVLVASDGSIFLFAGVDDCACKYYVALTTDNYIEINKEAKGGYWETSRAVYPATKEQRDTLEIAMADEGYEWDADKKELLHKQS